MIYEVITEYGPEDTTHCTTEDRMTAERLLEAIETHNFEHSPHLCGKTSIFEITPVQPDLTIWTHRAFWTFDLDSIEVEAMTPTFDRSYADRFLPENYELKVMPEWLCAFGTSAEDAKNRAHTLTMCFKALYEK